MRRRGGSIAVGLLVLLAAGCGGGSGSSAASPQTLLSDAKATIDRSSSLHFVLTSAGIPSNAGTFITGGTGDVGRPDQLQGTFKLVVSGFNVSVKVLAADGKFYAEPPFQTKYTLTNPATYGVGNPSQFIDPNTGLSTLLVRIQSPHSDGQVRLNGEVLDQVQGTVPGSEVPVLPVAVKSDPVAITAAVDPSSHQLRRVVLSGPFANATTSTFTLVLSDYGESVHVALPSG